LIEDVDAGEKDGRSWDGYKRLSIELEVTDDKGKGFLNRRAWKKYNLDSEKTNKAGKTPVEQLADAFFSCGLEFTDLDSLALANEKFAEMSLDVSFSTFKGSEGNDVQMVYINGQVDPARAEDESVIPSF
jgi:hypothetical protein